MMLADVAYNVYNGYTYYVISISNRLAYVDVCSECTEDIDKRGNLLITNVSIQPTYVHLTYTFVYYFVVELECIGQIYLHYLSRYKRIRNGGV